MPASEATILERLVELRQVPAFANAGLDELARLAEVSHAADYSPGAEVAAAGARVRHFHVIVDGRLRADSGREYADHDTFGVHEALAGRAHAGRTVAVAPTRTLKLAVDDLLELIEDNLGVMTSVLRDLARGVARAGLKLPASDGSRMTAPQPTGVALGLVERSLVLRRQPLFTRTHLQALFMLAETSTEVSYAEGTRVWRAGELANGAVFVVDGELRADDGGRFTAGHAIGLVETVAAISQPRTVTATAGTRALVCSAAALFDVLEDHADFGLAMLESFAGVLLDADADVAGAVAGAAAAT